jgi:hypothetical protein
VLLTVYPFSWEIFVMVYDRIKDQRGYVEVCVVARRERGGDQIADPKRQNHPELLLGSWNTANERICKAYRKAYRDEEGPLRALINNEIAGH